jgi:hypothetical protein
MSRSLSLARVALTPWVLSAAALVAVGCAVPLGRGSRATLERKSVAAKLAPDTLVATDGTRCTPSAGKYTGTAAGASVWCARVRTGAPGYGVPAP